MYREQRPKYASGANASMIWTIAYRLASIFVQRKLQEGSGVLGIQTLNGRLKETFIILQADNHPRAQKYLQVKLKQTTH